MSRQMPDATTCLGMTATDGVMPKREVDKSVIPSERSERRESSCITTDARRHYVAGHDGNGRCHAEEGS